MALREINLIPPDILDAVHLRRRIGIWGSVLTFSLAFIFGLYFYQTEVVYTRKSPVIAVSALESELTNKMAEIKSLKVKLEKLSQQQEVLQTIMPAHSYSALLFKLSAMMNGYTWLTQLRIDDIRKEEGRAEMEMTGFSFSNEDLGNLLNQLSAEPLFPEVVLKYAKETDAPGWLRGGSANMKLIRFQIECRLS
jgi:Tfp pilus assembly protein PilN